MNVHQALLIEQENELTAHLVYLKLSEYVKNKNNAEILAKISEDELGHYSFLKTLTRKDVRVSKAVIFFYYLLARILGLTFTVKLLERSEKKAIMSYSIISETYPDIKEILQDELRHEELLLNMISEERLLYLSSVVLGLNDALVELTGALAGFTFAFQNGRLIALTGLITGIAAAFSMAASEYLSAMQEKEQRQKALKAAFYTGLTYLATVFLLIMPYILIKKPMISLLATLIVAVMIILVFNYYISVAKDQPFKKRFLEMALISLGVAALSFCVGYLVRTFIGLDI